MKAWCTCAIAIVLLTTTLTAGDQESLSAARDLYAAAAYEDALLLLNRLRTNGLRAEDGRAIEQYRAFCLLALGRATDAERAIEAVVAAEPSYQPSDEEVSPRVRAAFTDVRRRMLPTIVQERYASAKAAFDRKEFAAAEIGFKQVLDVLADPDVRAAASQPPLSDLRMLATGFHDLAATAAAPPPPLPPVAAVPLPPALPPVPVPQRIYSAEDSQVTPPVTVRQVVPAFEFQNVTQVVQPPSGALEVVINERGLVESAVMRRSIYVRYDTLVIEAALTWQYRPARLDGVPVKYRKIIGISVKR